MQTIEFEVTRDFIHIEPAARLYDELKRASKDTGTRVLVRTSYESPLRPSEYSFSSFGMLDTTIFFDQLINTKKGERVIVSLEDSVPPEYLTELRRRLAVLF
jgi:hypothetical protein